MSMDGSLPPGVRDGDIDDAWQVRPDDAAWDAEMDARAQRALEPIEEEPRRRPEREPYEGTIGLPRERVTSEDYDLVCRLLIACRRAYDLSADEREQAFERCQSYVRELALAWGVAVDW